MPLPLKHALAWTALQFTSTVLDDIWPQVLFFSAVATMSDWTPHNLGMNPIMLSVVGTVVSLVVSFKTNNSYARWWDGRNIWANISSQSRQLAMLIWLQIPNVSPDTMERLATDAAKKTTRKSASPAKDAPGFCLHVPGGEGEDIKHSPTHSGPFEKSSESPICGEQPQQDEEDWENMRGLIEKKTYIGLVQAFGVAMKHALRGEAGPFYTDLYGLISFLPKYNPSVNPQITRDHLFVLWQNGIPRQKKWYDDDSIAVPLSQPAAFTGYAFNPTPGAPPPPPEGDAEAVPGGLTTTAPEFERMAMNEASSYFPSAAPTGEGRERRRSHCFARLDKKHRVVRQSEDRREQRTAITTVELMPPRHPPPARYWDFFPPLRIIKVVADWFKTRQMRERAKADRVRGGKRRRAGGVRTEIPLEILMYLSAYISDLIRRNNINSSLIGTAMTAILELQKATSDLEKIASTPIPSAYSFHLRLTVWAYLFFLPFQVHGLLGWLTVPAVAVASITYLGFLEIGAQIELPFAYDQSDLDLDRYVLNIAHQLAEVTAFPTTMPSSQIILSQLNQPFLSSFSLSALELLGEQEAKTRPTAKGLADSYVNSEDNKEREEQRKEKVKEAIDKDAEVQADRKDSTDSSSSTSSSFAGSLAARCEDADEDETKYLSPSAPHAEAEEQLVPRLKEPGGREEESGGKVRRRLNRSMRDVELALFDNWRTISAENDASIGKPRQQLENRSGLEVAVLTL